MNLRGLVAALCLATVLFGLGRAEPLPPENATRTDTAIAEARDLFLANRLAQALQTLDAQTLAQSGEANLLAGLIQLYRPQAGIEAARLHFERAGMLGVLHAFAILGNLTLDEACEDCAAKAQAYYQQALQHGEGSEARFGHALALFELGRQEAAQQEFQQLLFHRTPRDIRVWSATLAGTMLLESNPDRAEELLLMAASEDGAEAQAVLGLWLLRKGQESEAEIWLTRAVAQRAQPAMGWYETLSWERQGEVMRNAAGYLLDLARSPADTERARAFAWCGRSGRIDLVCLSRAADHHQECALSPTTREILDLPEFEHSAVYRACRSRELSGRPLPEKPGTWPHLAE